MSSEKDGKEKEGTKPVVVSESLHTRLKIEAAKKGLSLKDFLEGILKKELPKEEEE